MIETSEPQTSPTRWWQWVLMYPTLGLSLLGAIPTYSNLAQSYLKNVPFDSVAIVNKDDELWDKNAKCFREKEYTGITTNHNIRVEVLMCPNGDILAKVEKPNGEEKYRWIGFENLDHRSAFFDRLVAKAYADEGVAGLAFAQAGGQVLCKTFLGKGRIKRIIREPNGSCVEEIVNTRTGKVISSRSVPCSTSC